MKSRTSNDTSKPPELFVQAVAWVYKRKDDGADPAELQVPPEHLKNVAERGYKLLAAIRRIPGHDDLGELKSDRLGKWIAGQFGRRALRLAAPTSQTSASANCSRMRQSAKTVFGLVSPCGR